MSILLGIRRFFLPSKTLSHYVSKLYLIRFLGMTVGLVTVLQMLDLLGVSEEIMAADGANFSSILRYLSLRTPQLISQFIPFSALLATLLTLASLSQYSEIIIMKGLGLSAQRILMPLGLPCALIAGLHFYFQDTVVVNANAELAYWQDNEYAINLPPIPDYTTEARIVENGTLVLAAAVTRNGNIVILDRLSIYERDDRGILTILTRANFATYVDGNWRLFEVRRFNASTHEFEAVDNQQWDLNISPERFLSANINPDFVNAQTLWQHIKTMQAEGRATGTVLASFFKKFSGPAATLLMPLLGAIAGFGIHRAGSLLLRVVIGMALGFAFFVADNFMLAMGEFGVAPPFLAAGAPFLLFLTAGLALLLVTEE